MLTRQVKPLPSGWAGTETNGGSPPWQEAGALHPTGSDDLPARWPSPLTARLCLVCSTPHLPASSVFHLVWEPGWLAWEHHRLETLCRLSHLPHHALSLHWLLAGTQVPGTKNNTSDALVCVLEASSPLGVCG